MMAHQHSPQPGARGSQTLLKYVRWSNQLLKQLASLKLAVVVIVLLVIVSSLGTFIEARYNAQIAKKWVYDTPWMYLVLGLLAVNLTAVMIDRWPWKRRHGPFVLAHIGILILLLGAVLTSKWGLDGSLRVGVGQENRWVMTQDTEMSVWSSFDGDQFAKLLDRPVDFDRHPPEKNPIEITTDAGTMKVLRYHPFVLTSPKVVESTSEKAGSALRFQVTSSRFNVIEWLVQKRPDEMATHNFGPAQIHFGAIPSDKTLGNNEVFFHLREDGLIDYKVMYKDATRAPLMGRIKEGEHFATGWMDSEIHVLRVYPKAEEIWDFRVVDRPTEMTTSAVEIEFAGKTQWLQLNDTLKIFTDKSVFIVAYANRREDLGYSIFLKKFEVGRYQGTMRAASYQSLVEVPGYGEALIAMNSPLKYGNKTVYQASFQDGPDGRPVASVFSINDDPGRWLKYLGSLILSFGVVWMFYDKRKSARAMAPKQLKDELV